MTERLRDTKYAEELAHAANNYARIERLRIKETDQVEIRFSWWKDGRLTPRPLDLPEGELLELMEQAFEKDVFSEQFKRRLFDVLMKEYGR